MPLLYPIKHVYRNWKLFTALLIGITLAATFFAAIGVKANISAEQAIDKQLSSIRTDMEFTAPLNQSNLPLAYGNITSIEGVKKVDMVARLNSEPVRSTSDNYTNVWFPQMYSFPNTSTIYDEWINKPASIPENYTYVIAETELAKNVAVGDNITTVIRFPTPKYYNTSQVYVNLTVAGFATLTDKGYRLLSGYGGGYFVYATPTLDYKSSISGWRGDTLIISWENTLEKFWNSTLDSSTVDITFLVSVDRKALINPWNMDASIQNVNSIAQKIENRVLGSYLAHGQVTNYLGDSLYTFQNNFSYTLLNFFIVSLPVFFVAWYLGSTVSDVSFNIRRREIGLLSTKGLSSGQIQRMFLTEAVAIGLVGGFLGVVGGLILNQYYVGAIDLNSLFNSQMFNPVLLVATIIFGVVLALAAVFWSSRKAARLPAVDTLRDYMPADKPHRRIIPLIALILGTYKIVVFALGLNIQQVFYQLSYSGGNFFLSLISGPIVLIDSALTYIGPFLFLWGFTKLLIRDSTKFQVLASKISALMGDLGALAAKNVRRNPARLAAIAFIVALIIAFSVQVTGQIASQQDYTYRRVKADVGADVTVSVVNATRAQLILEDIRANVSGIRNASIQRELTAPLRDGGGQLTIRTIEPGNWSTSAYYEQEWFTETTIEQVMKEMANNNATIILERNIAKQLNLKLYDEIAINFASCPRQLKIVGFFGPESPYNTGPVIFSSSGGLDKYPIYVSSQYYSYVPRDLFNMTFYSDIYHLESFSTTILIKLEPGVNGTDVANQIKELEGLEVYSTNSFDEQWRASEGMNYLSTYSSLQVLDIQGLGLLFAVLSASVGTALIAIVSLKERSREATLMSVRGLSYRQLVWMFLTESMAIITFAVILGVVVGVIIVYGNITAANTSFGTATELVKQRFIYPVNAIATIGTYIALIYASTIGAILVMTSQYVTKLERMVRTR
ncbi:MAG: FtsX-like permease family protein [Candidatus Bathyarchaeota archaeon]|nr:FtsX-like permease family protein [Candidatus Bathyarchaeota archaeon]